MKADLPQMVFFTKKNGIRSWYGKLEKKLLTEKIQNMSSYVVVQNSNNNFNFLLVG